MTPDFRLNLQLMYDPDVACATTGPYRCLHNCKR